MNFRSTNTRLWVLAAALSIWMVGCQKDVDIFKPFGPSISELKTLLTDLTTDQANTTIFTLNGSDHSTTFTTSRGVQVILTDCENLFADAATNTATPCSTCQRMTIEVTDAFEKKEMVGLGLTSETNLSEPLSTAGMVLVEAFCDGKPLKLLPNKQIEVRLPTTIASFQTDSRLFFGSVENGHEVWSLGSDSPISQIQPIADGPVFYQLLTEKLGWLAVNKPIDGSTTSVCLSLPKEFTPSNTLAFIVLNDSKTVLPLDGSSDSAGVFCQTHAPIGQTVSFFTISKIGERLFLGHAETEIGTNQTFLLNPQETNEAELKTALQQI